jgi:hypothetical protein
MLSGVPALDLWVEMETYDDVHHKSSDTVDKIVAHNLVAGAGIVADSNASAEYDETRDKARALLQAITLAEVGL